MPDVAEQRHQEYRRPEKLALPAEKIARWREIIEQLRHQTGARSCLIRVQRGGHLQVLACATGTGAPPYCEGQRIPLRARPYCAKTLTCSDGFRVVNGSLEEYWRTGFDHAHGLMSYVGRPLAWSDRKTFGTICILHDEELDPSLEQDELLRQAGRVIEADLHAWEALEGARSPACAATTIGQPATVPGIIPGHDERGYTRLATVVEQATDGILITNTEGTIQYVNPAFERINGYRRDELVGQSPRVLKSDRNDPALYENMWDTITRGAVWTGHLLNKRKDGTLYQAEVTIFPLLGDDDRIVNYAEVMRDVTQEIELETRLRQVEKMEALGQLASGVAHDFNNILTAILGSIGLLRMRAHHQPASDASFAEGLEHVEQAARQGAALTRQLLNFNRPQAIKLESLDPRQIVRRAERMLRRLIRTSIRFHLEVDPHVHAIRGDAGQFEQILMNLVVNAADAMPAGGYLDVALKNAELDESYVSSHADACIGPHVLLTVRDTGCGMPADVLNRIYEPFFTTKPSGKGTGLGLATVYAIVRRFGGHITVTSAPDEGAEFRVYLPALLERVKEDKSAAAGEVRVRGHETVLVCEDDEVIRNLECELLEDHGYSVLPAAHGVEALELAREHLDEIDVVVTDVVMPEMSGPALANELAGLRPDLRVLFVSGYTMDALAQLGASEGHQRFLPKPFTSRGFLETVRATLDEAVTARPTIAS